MDRKTARANLLQIARFGSKIGDTLVKIESNVNVQFWLVEEAMNARMQDCLPTHVSAKKTVQRVRVLSDRQ